MDNPQTDRSLQMSHLITDNSLTETSYFSSLSTPCTLYRLPVSTYYGIRAGVSHNSIHGEDLQLGCVNSCIIITMDLSISVLSCSGSCHGNQDIEIASERW